MNLLTRHRTALIVAVAIAAWLRFGLEATGFLFYELYHLTGIDAVYWGYTVFRGAGYYFGIWPYQDIACAGVAALIIGIALWRGQRDGHSGATP